MRLPKLNSPDIFKGCYIAGGAVLSTVTKTEISDYDIYPKSKEAFKDIIYQLDDDSNFFPVNISDRAITYKCNSEIKNDGTRATVQVMFTPEFFPVPETIFDQFDFTVCMGAYDYDTEQYHFHPDFFIDVASKTFRFNIGTRYPINSLLRTIKYQKKGYHLLKGEMLKLGVCMIDRGLPPSWEALEESIGGTYGKTLKLHREGLDYTVENIFKILDDFDIDTAMVEQNDLENILLDPELIFDIIFKEPREYIFLENGTLIIIDGENIQKSDIKENQIPSNWVNISDSLDSSRKFYGYKCFYDDGSDIMLPWFRGRHSMVRYQEGSISSWANEPYIYVYSTLEKAKSIIENNYDQKKKGYIHKVEFTGKDIKGLGTGYMNEIQVSSLTVKERVIAYYD